MTAKQAEVETGKAAAKVGRTTSGTAYPYFNLDQSIKVAQAVHERGGGACTPDQLASFLEYKTIRSGTYLVRIAAARLFGLIVAEQGRIGITDRARAILSPVMPEDTTQAKIDAFLAVPLFSAVYERFLGHTLPPEAGLKNLFEQQYKIVKDRIAPAVRVFYESADQAGFFIVGGDRTKLIKPLGGRQTTLATPPVTDEQASPPPAAPQEKPRHTGGGDGPLGVHAAIIGLLRELPPAGQAWPKAKKERFLKAFQTTVDFIYPENDELDA
jgi:hypothetical protein